MAEFFFTLITVLPLPIWLSMMLFPKTRFTEKMVLSYWPFIGAGALHALLLLAALAIGDVSLELSFNALRSSFSSPWGIALVWLHLLALNLFAGVWIFRDAKYWGIKPLPFLLPMLLVGPAGLAAYLYMRQRRSKTDPIRMMN